MDELPPPPTLENPFDQVQGRRTADTLLSNLHVQMTTLSGQADLKANIIITASSIVLSISVALGSNDPELRPGVFTLGGFILIALGAAILSVLPKVDTRAGQIEQFTDGHDPLFFGHFIQLPRELFEAYMAEVLADDAEVYRVLTRNLHSQGWYLVTRKYRYLRIAYLAFLVAFVASALVQGLSFVA